MRAMANHRPCERHCAECHEWKHHSRFHSWKRSNSTVATFAARCRDCEQKARNEKKNADRPLAIIEQRAAAAATKAGKNREFFWIEMGYRTLVPILRALMTPEGLCQGCGHKFVNERDIQIEHSEPPRHDQDWARLHAGNLRFLCGSCNRKKANKPYAQWLDEQESARLSNLKNPTNEAPLDDLPLFSFKCEAAS